MLLQQSIPYLPSLSRSVDLSSVSVFVALAAIQGLVAHGGDYWKQAWKNVLQRSICPRRVAAGRKDRPQLSRTSLPSRTSLTIAARLVWTRLCGRQKLSTGSRSSISRKARARVWRAVSRGVMRRSRPDGSDPASKIRIGDGSNPPRNAYENAELCGRWNSC